MKTFFIQPLAVISIFFVGYVLVNYTFYQKVSEEWIDALWAFPIFFVHGCIAIYVYFQLNEY